MANTPLTPGTSGDAVAHLYSQLQQLGFELPVSKLLQKVVGPVTQQAEQLFQQQHGRVASGMIDDATASSPDYATHSSVLEVSL